MPDIINIEYRNEASSIRFPFAKDSVLVDSYGVTLPDDFAVDAVLYPRTGTYSLQRIYRSPDGSQVYIRIVTDTKEIAEGEIKQGKDAVDFYDADGFHRGVLILGSAASEYLENPADHEFYGATFCRGCQFELGSAAVDSLTVDGVKLHGDINFAHAGGRVAIKPVVTENEDSSKNIRFDVSPVSSITDVSSTGIRTIYVLRQPTSMFNVLDNGGSPYLYIVKPGSPSTKIGRDFICSYKNDKKGGGSYKERSYSDDCGNSYTKGTTTTSCFPDLSYLDEFARHYDPETREIVSNNVSFGYSYGYKLIPTLNGFRVPSTMCTMFIEGEIFVSMQAYNYGVLANFNVYVTDAAKDLFYDSSSPVTDESFSVPLKHTAYTAFFDYLKSMRLGKLGFVDKASIERMCEEHGWLASDDDLRFPDDVDAFEFTYNLKKSINDAGLASYRSVYINRARDFFEHFNCLNWEVSGSDRLGDEVRWLVGWGTGNRLFAGGNSYVTVKGDDGTEARIPAWIISRYVWWKKYSKRGTQLRHFIVPKDRGLTIYTGSYYTDDSVRTEKELSPASWACDVPLLVWCGTVNDSVTLAYTSNKWMDPDIMETMRERLHAVYDEDYDPTFGDASFKYSKSRISDPVEVKGFDIDALDTLAKGFDNRVTTETLVDLPAGAPISTDDVDDSLRTISGSWPGPFEFMYDKVYIPGTGFDDGETTESIRAPVAFKFDIDKTSTNAFNIDVTDMTAVGMVYKNPIHIGIVEGGASPNTLNIKNPTDTDAVSNEMTNLTTPKTSGNGIEISIPGLGE